MIIYEKEKLIIKSDFEIRTLMEQNSDVDLFIPTNFRTLNLYLEDLPDYIDSRIQLTEVKKILYLGFPLKKIMITVPYIFFKEYRPSIVYA